MPFSCKQARSDIIKGIDDCIDTWSEKSGTPKSAFDSWKHEIYNLIDHRSSSLTDQKRSKSSIFDNAVTKQCLNELQSTYVMVPIDKAANNVAFICKRYYAQVLLEELGLIGSSSSTYTKIDELIS